MVLQTKRTRGLDASFLFTLLFTFRFPFLFLALAFLATLACLLVVVAFGEDRHAATKLSEVDLAIVVFIQHLHGFLDVICTDFLLENTNRIRIRITHLFYE